MTKQYDYLVVGAGFFGAVIAERIATQLGKSVLVIDKRNHIGGNSYSEIDSETGIEYHTYGTHIFHTNSDHIWEYLTKFTKFNSYAHQVLTIHKDKVFQMPINLETINTFYNLNLKPYEVEEFLEKERNKEQYPNPKNLEEKAISLIGRPLYEAFIKGYTAKQWGKDPKELPASIINRLPVRKNYNETYFNNAKYQGIPLDGYTKIFEKLLDHKLIEVKLETDYFEFKDQIEIKEKTIYSGPIDRYFDFQFGELEWRTVYLKKEVQPYDDYQGTSVMNYADQNVEWTRIHEPLHLHPERNYKNNKTIIFYETSGYDPKDPYYPINNKNNQEIYRKYVELSKKESNVIFGGRLGNYAYYDMDQSIANALSTFETKIKK
ncbi:MAG: UDP-galactopyranose mutase [Bdellovibrionota bacterium]|nr:UDP-galactopyranose mutase [Bdellovibrionota bacterium]